LPTAPWNSLAPSGSPATASPAGKTREPWPKVRPAARNQIAWCSQPQPRYPPERDRVRQARPSHSACCRCRAPRETGTGCAGDQRPPNADPATALPGDWRAPPGRRGRKRVLAPGARALRGHGQPDHSPASPAARYEQPEQPHRMTRGGSSWSRTFSSSARPSVSTARRVSSGRLTGSADHALPLISITTCATSAPRVISQRQPRAPAPARTCLPRFALICQPISARIRHPTPRRASRARRPGRGPGRPSGPPEPGAAPRGPARDQVTVSDLAWPTPSASSRRYAWITG
jgi:hypothetical protein